MYKAFNLKISMGSFKAKFPESINLEFMPSKIIQKTSLDKAVESLGSLDAEEIRKTWFKDSHIDVFLSHSSKDEELAKILCAYLRAVFDLNVFIDSEAWHHMDIMLQKLDQKYCVSEKNEDGTVKTYLYASRNVTTSHVHMILSHVLPKMIDNAECFIYLNTPNSTSHQDDTSIGTLSPWLFHELAMVEIIDEKKPFEPLLEGYACDSEDNRSYGPTINYSVNTKRLKSLSLDQVKLWQERFSRQSSSGRSSSLRLLYNIVD